MKINEFIEYMRKNTNRTMKEEQVISTAKKALNVKPYMSIKDKRELVEKIVSKCIYFENGIFKIDNIQKYVYFTMLTLNAYMDLELGDDIEDDFDALSEEKLLPLLICTIQQEYDDVNIFLQMHCDYILEDNSLEVQFGNFLSAVLEKVDGVEATLKTTVPELLKKIDLKSIMKHKDAILDVLKNFNK